MARLANVFAFRPAPVTLLTFATFVSIITALLWIHLVPPPIASASTLASWDVSLTEAWSDLRELTSSFRPYNSHRNDDVRAWLLQRIGEIVNENKNGGWDGELEVIDDNNSNVLFTGSAVTSTAPGLTVYFEGTNVMVWIKGTEEGVSPVLVNAHYDSVSTGYGATDDGKAVVSVLQVIRAFTSPKRSGDNRLKRGLIALLNNGEEDYLNGARAFAIHPLANITHSFLNLEGAGAGGRATLFRSTDAEITKFYGKSKNPFGTVMADDGFKQGLIRSQTDYKVFVENLGMRGLDVAFWTPRSKYHTEDDDVKHTSKESLWHMLGTSLQTLDALTSYTGGEFDQEGDTPAGTGHLAVWFDLFGKTFAVFRLHTLFALTITFIVVPFIIILLTLWVLHVSNKLYYFSNTPLIPQPPEFSDLPRTTRGWRGFFRWPAAVGLASAAVVGLAYLINKFNPMIAYSSEYSVWAMFLSLWWCLVWFILRGADAIRPTALGRGYAFLQQWAVWWVLLFGVAVLADSAHIASGYWILISSAGVFLCACISLLELFGLPRRPVERRPYSPLSSSGDLDGHSQVAASDFGDDDDVTERTPLFRGNNRPTTFGGYSRTVGAPPATPPSYLDGEGSDYDAPDGVFGGEQSWSADLPSWLWLPQFLLAVPVPLIFTGSLSLFAATALAKTGADGGSTLTFYLLVGILSILMLLPVSPFFHRVSYHLTFAIFLLFVGTLAYNLAAFPFSHENRLKVYFQQTVDIQTGENQVHLVGHADFIKRIVSEYIPSASGQDLVVKPDNGKDGLARVSWQGLSPRVVESDLPDSASPADLMRDWIATNVTSLGLGKARIFVSGKDTRACKILFDKPVASVNIVGPTVGELGNPFPAGGVKELRLWGRNWGEGWKMEVEWSIENTEKKKKPAGLSGKVVCLWSDANDMERTIPALWEVQRYMPQWAVVSKLADGLVEAHKPFNV